MTPALHQRLVERCRGRCECGVCGLAVPPGELDHIFGRAKSDESEATCWFLTPGCHYRKTQNIPDASHWLKLEIAHFKRYGYVESQRRAEARLQFVDTRREFDSALGAIR